MTFVQSVREFCEFLWDELAGPAIVIISVFLILFAASVASCQPAPAQIQPQPAFKECK